MRASRFTLRRGPLVIYSDEDSKVKQNARNLPGVDVCNVHRLNLLTLAPGGHLGRFVIFTKNAFNALDNIFGTYNEKGTEKSGFQLGRTHMDCADIARIINSDNVQNALREIRTSVRVHDKTRHNPLKNRSMMQKLNPYAKQAQALNKMSTEQRKKDRAASIKAKRSKAGSKDKATRNARFNGLANGLEEAFVEAHDIILEEIRMGKIESSDEEEEDSDE